MFIQTRMYNMQVYIDGKYYEKEDSKVSVFDHGFLCGDGIFEGIWIYSG
jgi:branched-chain amino acid aminotransferase